MQVGTGKSVLNGIAIGKLKIYKKKDTAISTAPVADTAAELERFEAARQKAIEQQTALYEKALAEAGEDIAEVFNIHAMMLDDDDFVDAIKEIINGQKMCAEYAVKTAEPPSGISNVPMICSKVVLPAPLGPTMLTISPFSISRSIPRNTCRLPKLFVIFSK